MDTRQANWFKVPNNSGSTFKIIHKTVVTLLVTSRWPNYFLFNHKKYTAVSNRRNGLKSFRVQTLFSDSLCFQNVLCSNDDVTHLIGLQGPSLYWHSLYWILRVDLHMLLGNVLMLMFFNVLKEIIRNILLLCIVSILSHRQAGYGALVPICQNTTNLFISFNFSWFVPQDDQIIFCSIIKIVSLSNFTYVIVEIYVAKP